MKIVHVVECFAGGVFSFLSNLTNELDKDCLLYTSDAADDSRV